MRRIVSAFAAAALALAATGEATKLATRDWTRKFLGEVLAEHGVDADISTADVVSNRLDTAGTSHTNIVIVSDVVTNCTPFATNVYSVSVAVTNVTHSFPTRTITVESPFKCPTAPSCVSISFTFEISAKERAGVARRPSLFDLLFAPAFAAGSSGKKLTMTLEGFRWIDLDQIPHDVVLESGYEFVSKEELPEKPSDKHVCDLDANCNCKMMDNTIYSVKVPDEYNFDPEAPGNTLLDWQDNWLLWVNLDSWPESDKIGSGDNTVYKLYDDNNEVFYLHDAVKSDAWKRGVKQAWKDACEWYDKCAENYIMSKICDKRSLNPQHTPAVLSCGASSPVVCGRCGAAISGSHQYANGHDGTGRNGNHYCVCGYGEPRPHVLSTGEEHVATDNGWTSSVHCTVPGCGYAEDEIVHTHHHVNCQPCTEDGCNEPCTCGGNHVWELTSQKKCAKCVCEGCDDCEAKPPESDMSLHKGWTPCGRLENPTMEDNANGAAAGVHCECQCKVFCHDTSDHDYKAQEDTYVYYDEEQHRRLFGNDCGICSRCGQRRGTLEPHEESTDPEDTSYARKTTGGTDVCELRVKCFADGCGYVFKEDQAHSPDSETETYTSVPPSICRHKVQCENCKSWITEDGEHVRDASNKCKCANGCGYQLAHEYPQSANSCGFYACIHCGEMDETRKGVHVGWTNEGATHVCACGSEREEHDDERVYKGKGEGANRVYTYTCKKCLRSYDASEPCWPHVFPVAPTSTRTEGSDTIEIRECCFCNATEEKRVPQPPPEGCSSEQHYANTNGACGCLCGYYPNTEAGGEEWHRWAETVDGNGNQICTCKCKQHQYHKAREWSTYAKNNGDACENVCAYCRDYAATANGIVDNLSAADEELHTELSDALAAKRRHCGCRCGKLDQGATDEKFHRQMTGSCRCWGSGEGGSWHFPCPKTGCTAICQYRSDGWCEGEEHLAASSKMHVSTQPPAANVEDHTKASSRCGCACGEYTSADIGRWNGVDLHVFLSDGDCECECRTKKRHDFTDGPHVTGYKPGWVIKKYRCSRCEEWDDEEILEECKHGEKEKVQRVRLADGMYNVTCKCKKCAYQWTELEGDAVPEGGATCSLGAHVKRSDGKCGCLCTHVPVTEGDYHVYPNDETCVCECGKYHRPRNWARADNKCLGICGRCKTRKMASGLLADVAATESDHTPAKTWCGCMCKTIKGEETRNPKFHPRHPDSCRCYGSNGQGDGWFHYPCRDPNCTKLCKYRSEGKRHLANKGKEAVYLPTFDNAKPTDHTPKTDGDCGCVCGDITSSSPDIDARGDDGQYHLHRWANGRCICVCGKCPQHKAVANPGCTEVCAAYSTDSYDKRTGGLYYCPAKAKDTLAATWRIAADTVKKLHTSREDGCGCKCGKTSLLGGSGRDFPEDENFHYIPDGSCWCTCGKNASCAWHRFKDGNLCEKICNGCRETSTKGMVKKSLVNTAKQTEHTRKTGHCGCKCDDERSLGYDWFHPWKNGYGCKCCDYPKGGGGHHLTRNHVNVWTEQTGTDTYVCETCGNTVGVTHYTDHCANETNNSCFYYPYSYKTEQGHAPDCGAAPDGNVTDDDREDKDEDPEPDPTQHCPICHHEIDSWTGRCPFEGEDWHDNPNHNETGNYAESGDTGGSGSGGGSSLIVITR